jgi:hypothetical protein
MNSSILFPPRSVPMLLVDWELAGITPPSPPPGAPPHPVEAPPPTDLPVPVREPPKPTPTTTEQVRKAQVLARLPQPQHD